MTANKQQPRKLLAVVESPVVNLDEMTDEELDDFADDLFDKVKTRWEN